MPASLSIARASLHMWEEPCISGDKGSGTVFFTGCSLGCVFCQNHNISDGSIGIEITVEELSQIFLRLQEMGALNINLVTPTHYAPDIAESLKLARKNGLKIPIVYNTSGYEHVSTLKLLDGLIDIYLPDFKYVDSTLSARYSKAADYFEVAKPALLEMYRQVGPVRFDDNGIMTKGMIVRHLILPSCTTDSKAVIKYLYETYGDNIFMSIMSQFTPLDNLEKYPEINRKITEEEYDDVVNYAIDLGVGNAFVQDGEAAKESFIPDFESFDLQKFLKQF